MYAGFQNDRINIIILYFICSFTCPTWKKKKETILFKKKKKIQVFDFYVQPKIWIWYKFYIFSEIC